MNKKSVLLSLNPDVARVLRKYATYLGIPKKSVKVLLELSFFGKSESSPELEIDEKTRLFVKKICFNPLKYEHEINN